MQKAVVVGLLAAVGAFAGILVNGQHSTAAEEIRCRVNVDALVQDIAALRQKKKDAEAETLRKLLQPKTP